MFSKYINKKSLNIFSKLILLLSLMGTLSCTPKIGEEPPEPQGPALSGTECLSDAMTIAKNFFKGDATDKEIDGAFSCAMTAFDKFRRYVRGSSPDGYTPQELSDFLRMNFLKKNSDGSYPEVPRGLQVELMKFKQMFVGGSREFITLNEINQSILTIKKFKAIARNLNPHMKILMLNWDVANRVATNEDLKSFELANETLQDAASDLTSMIMANRPTYVISDFSNLMIEFAKFYKETWDFNEKIDRYMPVVKKIKKAIAGGDENQIVDNEWNSFLLLTLRGYVQYLRYYYFIESQDKNGSAVRLGYIARSIEDIFAIFKDLVAIKPGGVVTVQEAQDLLKAFSMAWPDFKYSDDLVSDFMKIKTLFFGGNEKQWAVDDFERARLKVGNLKNITEKVLPYISIYTLEWNKNYYSYEQAVAYFKDAEVNLISASTELGGLLESNYSFSDLQSFIAEIDRLYPPASTEASLSQLLEKYIPLVEELKKIIFTESDQDKLTIKSNQWSVFLSYSSRIYLKYLYSYYFLNDQIQQSEKLASLQILADSVNSLLTDLINFKTEKNISKQEILNLVYLIRDYDNIISKQIKKENLESAMNVLLKNILTSPEDRLAGRVETGLTLKGLQNILNEFRIWNQTEIFLFDLFQSKKLSQADFIKAISDKYSTFFATNELKTSFVELRLILDSNITMANDNLGRIIISPTPSLYDYSSVSRMNIMRAFSRIMIRGLSEDMKRINDYSGITLDELKLGYGQLKGVFIDLELLDPASDSFADARFREANLFTPKANGDNLGSFKEVVDILTMITSGLSIDKLFKDDIQRVCLPGTTNINDFKLVVDKNCLMNVYAKMYQHLDSLPEYGKYIRSVSMDEWTNYFNNVLKASGHLSSMGNSVQMTHVSLLPHIMQYIEMTMTRFDVNNDTVIDTQEAIKAYPSFKNLLKEIAKDDLRKGNLKEEDLLSIFTYILKFGAPPESLWDKAYWKFYWKNNPKKWNVRANRTKLSYILGYISEKVASSKAVDLLKTEAEKPSKRKKVSINQTAILENAPGK